MEERSCAGLQEHVGRKLVEKVCKFGPCCVCNHLIRYTSPVLATPGPLLPPALTPSRSPWCGLKGGSGKDSVKEFLELRCSRKGDRIGQKKTLRRGETAMNKWTGEAAGGAMGR